MEKADWKSIVGSVAPTIATALGGPLAGMAVSAISQAVLGKPDASETDVANAVAKANSPETLTKLKEAENTFALKMKELDINVEKIAAEDRASARTREIALKDKTPRNLAYGYTIGYFIVLALIVCQGDKIAAGVKDLVNILLGILSAAQMAIVTYYFGSSSGSAKKSEMLDQQLLKK
jgi:hypothetical protein